MQDPDGTVDSHPRGAPNMALRQIITNQCICCGLHLEYPRIEYREEIQGFLCHGHDCRTWFENLLSDEIEIIQVESR